MRAIASKYSGAVWVLAAALLTTVLVVCAIAGGSTALLIMVGGIAALVIVSLLSKRPEYAPLLVVAAAVYDRHIYFDYEHLQLTTLVVVLALTAPAFAKAAIRSTGLPGYVLPGSLMLGLGLVLATITSPQPDLAAVGTIRWMLVINMIIGTVALCTSRPGILRRIVWWILAGGAVAAAFGIMQRAGIYFLIGAPYAPGVYNSTFGYYSNFANFEAVAAILGVGLLLELGQERKRGLLTAAVLTAMSAYSVAVSLSRGALICMGIGVAIILLRQITKPGRFIGIVTALGLIGWLVWALTPEKQQDAFIERFTYVPAGDLVREQMQAGGLLLAGEYPLGIGFNNFRTFVATGVVGGSQALAHAHNTFAQMTLDAGWLGLAGFLVLASFAALSAIRQKVSSARLGAGAALVGFLAQVTQDFFFFEAASMTAFGLILALAATKTSPKESEGLRVVDARVDVRANT